MRPQKLLLAQCYRNIDCEFESYYGLAPVRESLLARFPQLSSWFPAQIFDADPRWPERPRVQVMTSPTNVAGHFLAAQLDTPTKVIDEPMTPELLRSELADGDYTHVGLSVFVNGYSDYIECARTMRAEFPDVMLVAGNVGALFPDAAEHAHRICRGLGVPFLRGLLGEPVDAPYRLSLIPSPVESAGGHRVHMITQLGCPLRCDFCVTNAMFGTKLTNLGFTPEQVRDALVDYAASSGCDHFRTVLSEPNALIDLNWWYRLFELFRGLPGDYPLVVGASSRVLQKLDYSRVMGSALRFETISFGVESFADRYNKNRGVDFKSTIQRLKEHGIATYATYIVGFDHHDKKNVWEEIEQLVDLGAALTSALNLHPLPGTSVFQELKAAGRLLDLPWDFYYLPGFQAFLHPHFEPGFTDMLPLMSDILAYIERERGLSVANLVDVWRSVPDPRPNLNRALGSLRAIADSCLESWQRRLNPTPSQVSRARSLLEV